MAPLHFAVRQGYTDVALALHRRRRGRQPAEGRRPGVAAADRDGQRPLRSRRPRCSIAAPTRIWRPRTASRRSTPCSTCSGRRKPAIRSPGRTSIRRPAISRYMKRLLEKGADPNAAADQEGVVLGLQLRPVRDRRSRRDAVLARRLRRRRRGDEAAGRRYGADPGHPDGQAARPSPHRRRRHPPARGRLGHAGDPGRRSRQSRALLAAAGAGYSEGFAANSHRYSPGGMLAAVKYMVEELGMDVNARDHEGNTRAAPRRLTRRQRDDPRTWSRRARTRRPSTARARRRSTWPTAPCSARSRTRRRSSCSRGWARRTTTSASLVRLSLGFRL